MDVAHGKALQSHIGLDDRQSMVMGEKKYFVPFFSVFPNFFAEKYCSEGPMDVSKVAKGQGKLLG